MYLVVLEAINAAFNNGYHFLKNDVFANHA